MKKSVDQIKEMNNVKADKEDLTSDQTKEIYKQTENKLPNNV